MVSELLLGRSGFFYLGEKVTGIFYDHNSNQVNAAGKMFWFFLLFVGAGEEREKLPLLRKFLPFSPKLCSTAHPQALCPFKSIDFLALPEICIAHKQTPIPFSQLCQPTWLMWDPVQVGSITFELKFHGLISSQNSLIIIFLLEGSNLRSQGKLTIIIYQGQANGPYRQVILYIE